MAEFRKIIGFRIMKIIKIRTLLLCIPIFICNVQFSNAKAIFMGLEEVIAVSDFIGVIEITKPEKIGELFQENLPKRGFWKYSQKNIFKVISIIKRLYIFRKQFLVYH